MYIVLLVFVVNLFSQSFCFIDVSLFSSALRFFVTFFFFFNDTATTEIYTLHIVGSVRCVQETEIIIVIQNKLCHKKKYIDIYIFDHSSSSSSKEYSNSS
eukprot:TRINITY_DN7763_c0_g1_i1.p2 TRINITY_DN7763_c0_g1~~TRINITY_DN7763_c0_g1_i1.p2  ORF type:complete len:100 (-),score=24.95 TRINITY_DN7763_c0_g1_i1:129-428(-)